MTAQTLVTLNINGRTWDRVSGNAPFRGWQDLGALGGIGQPACVDGTGREPPSPGRCICRSWTGVGLTSGVISQTIYFDVNPQQPRSAGYRMFDNILSSGAGGYSSSTYKGRGTLGQTLDSPESQSASYTLAGGYEAASQALPLVDPGYVTHYVIVSGLFASGNTGTIMTSTVGSGQSTPHYSMVGTLGEWGLPNNTTTLTSQTLQHQPGFLAAAVQSQAMPVPTPVPGPTPIPTPQSACQFPTISINRGALYTTDVNVTLTICAPKASQMMISNDGGFQGAQWQPYRQPPLDYHQLRPIRGAALCLRGLPGRRRHHPQHVFRRHHL